MHHSDKFAHSRGGYPAPTFPDEGANLRMLSAMAEPDGAIPGRHLFSAYAPRARESDRAYFGRRSQEERAAASEASGAEARDAHCELSAVYARLSGVPTLRRRRALATGTARFRLAAASRAERQDALLDAALMETFPASDPVSVVLPN